MSDRIEHMAGPWWTVGLADHNGNYTSLTVGTNRGGIAGMLLYSDEQKRTAAANARMISAAPDSYAANLAFVAAIIKEYNIPNSADEDYIYDTVGSSMAHAFSMARAAIAKAEGETK